MTPREARLAVERVHARVADTDRQRAEVHRRRSAAEDRLRELHVRRDQGECDDALHLLEEITHLEREIVVCHDTSNVLANIQARNVRDQSRVEADERTAIREATEAEYAERRRRVRDAYEAYARLHRETLDWARAHHHDTEGRASIFARADECLDDLIARYRMTEVSYAPGLNAASPRLDYARRDESIPGVHLSEPENYV